MTIVILVVATIVLSVVGMQLVCFTIALYEMMNLPEAGRVRLTGVALVAALRDFVVETTGVVLFVLALPLGALPWPRARRLAPGDLPPVIVIPGWAMNRVCFALLAYRLRRDGWRHVVGLNYRTVGGDVGAAAAHLRDTVERIRAETQAPTVTLLGHSMGGLVARAYLRDHGGVDRVAKLVTLGTPHQGTKLASIALDPMVHAMRPDGPLIQGLADDDPLPAALDVTAIYSSFDHLVVPASRGHYPGAGNIEIEGVGHMGLLWSRRVYDVVRENLEYEPSESPREPAPSAPASDSGAQPAARASASTHRSRSV